MKKLEVPLLNEDVIEELTMRENEHRINLCEDFVSNTCSGLNLYQLQEFLWIFPHRRENMSLKYISKQLGLSIDALIIWFHFESVNIFKKKHGLYVDCREFMRFMRKISNKNYVLTHSGN